jgi:hypothetical protein
LDVTVDASLAEAGRRTFAVLDENVRHPPGLALQQVSPTTVRIDVTPAGGGEEGHRGAGQGDASR